MSKLVGPPTPAQLKNGAHGVAYRAAQLAGVVAIGRIRVASPQDAGTIQNALVESALVNARALAWFFTRPGDVHTSNYPCSWDDDQLVKVAAKAVKPISQHLGHVTAGAPEGERHPGAWPIPELAVVLVGGVARFVQTLEERSSKHGGWFTPSPVDAYDALMAVNPLSSLTEPSENPRVGRLTRALQKYLRSLD